MTTAFHYHNSFYREEKSEARGREGVRPQGGGWTVSVWEGLFCTVDLRRNGGAGGIRDNKRLSVFISPASLVSGPPLSHLRASECVCVCVRG